ncbi:leucine-rich repeat domain-containing protein [Spirosoma linguale]|uniref:Leucine-rich repeat protein n=1 Tax=Spirosoma linguale (strain ATCC 33905 / DSM 74 / LMG 10896 / Claus 1) TaxID=504472 RepID=D2QNI2_SPILD|nr:leucine-rich repeat protein [Spirosoma linguale DSM 74]
MYFFQDDYESQPETVEERLFHIRSCLSTKINLNRLSLDGFPEEVFNYPQVTHLYIGNLAPLSQESGNFLINIIRKRARETNDSVAYLEEIAEIRRCMTPAKTIGHLPDRISELTNLEELYLVGQQLTELPESLCELPNLKRLYVHNNKLTTLPAKFNQLKSLVCLNVRDNPIKTWPDGFWEMPFINQYQRDLEIADQRETELLLEKNYKAARTLRSEAIRWGLHW